MDKIVNKEINNILFTVCNLIISKCISSINTLHNCYGKSHTNGNSSK